MVGATTCVLETTPEECAKQALDYLLTPVIDAETLSGLDDGDIQAVKPAHREVNVEDIIEALSMCGLEFNGDAERVSPVLAQHKVLHAVQQCLS